MEKAGVPSKAGTFSPLNFSLSSDSHIEGNDHLTYGERSLGCLKLKILEALLPINIGQMYGRNESRFCEMLK